MAEMGQVATEEIRIVFERRTRCVIRQRTRSIPFRSVIPTALSLILIIGSVVCIVFKIMSNRTYHEKWKDYDECGLVNV